MKSRKKILYYLLTGLTTTSLTLSACSCELFGNQEQEHQHAWSEWQVTTSPTCKSKGEKKHTCECGEEETQEIAQTTHKAGTPKIVQEATCTEAGLSATYCSDCDQKLNESPIAPKGHSYVELKASIGDCYTEGYTAHKECSTCGETQGKQSTGLCHEVSVTYTVKAATDHEDGTAYIKCYECGYDGREVKDENGNSAPEYIVLPMKHTVVEETTVQATCYSDGETQKFCLDCLDDKGKATALAGTTKIVSKETMAHTFDLSVKGEAETCSEAGYTNHHICSVCGIKGDDYQIITPTHVFNEAGKCMREECGVETFNYQLVTNEQGNAIGYFITKFHNIENDTRDSINIPEEYAHGTEGATLPVIGIGTEAFRNVTTIKSVILSKNIKTIDKKAFENCIQLESINLENVETLGQSAFENCSALKAIALDKLSTLSNSAFEGCSSLEKVELKSEKLKEIGTSAFESCLSLREILVSKYIEKIGENAFKNCPNIEKITIPYIGLTANDTKTFSSIFGGDEYAPYSLKEISVISATELVDGAFKNIYAQIITLPKTVTKIGEEAFAGCVSLTNITFQGKAAKNDFSDIIKIGKNAFANSGLTTVILPFLGETLDTEENATLAYAFGDNCNVVNITLNNATKLYDEAFKDAKKLAYVQIPAVTEIGKNAFNGCTSLKTIKYASEQANVIPTTVTKIGFGAFAQIAVTEITLPFIGETLDSTTNNYIGYVFSDQEGTANIPLNVGKHKSLSKITILQGSNVTANAFTDCKNLTDLILPCTIASINENAFANCEKLKNVTILRDNSNAEIAYLTTIKAEAFKNCKALNVLSFDNRALTTVGDSAFENCSLLTTFDFPETGFVSLGDKAFKDCSALSSIELEAGLTAIGNYTFAGCTALLSIEFNEGLQEVGDYAFNDCTSLNNITMNDELLTIGEYAFKNCRKLTKISVPESVITIGKGAFQSCNQLVEMVLPFVGNTVNHDVTNGSFTWFFDSLVTELPASMKVTLSKATKLTNGAFTNYTGLKEIILPTTLKEIDESAFANCSGLTKVTFLESESNVWNLEKIGDMAFKKTAISEIVLPSSVKKIGTEAFSRNPALTLVTLPEGLETINDMAFEDCSALSSIILPASIKRLNGYAFRNCEGLKNLVIPSTIEYIGEGVFENCAKMQVSKTEIVKKELVFVPTSLVFEAKVTIGDYAFKNCASLTREMIFKTPSTVGSNAFYGCTSLEYIFIQVSVYEEVPTIEPEETPGATEQILVQTSYFGDRVFNSNESGKAIKIYVTENVDNNENWKDWKIGVNPDTTVSEIESYEKYQQITVAIR